MIIMATYIQKRTDQEKNGIYIQEPKLKITLKDRSRVPV